MLDLWTQVSPSINHEFDDCTSLGLLNTSTILLNALAEYGQGQKAQYLRNSGSTVSHCVILNYQKNSRMRTTGFEQIHYTLARCEFQ